MLKNNSNIGLMVLVAVVVIAGILIIFNQDRTYIWDETFRIEGNEPYDLSVIYELVNQATEGEMVITNEALATSLPDTTNTTYYFFGQYMYIDSVDADALFDYIEKGNTAFLASNDVPEWIHYELEEREIWLGGYTWAMSEKVYPNLISNETSSEKKNEYAYRGETEELNNHWWYYIITEADEQLEEEIEAEETQDKDEVVEAFFGDDSTEETDSVSEKDSVIVETLAEEEEMYEYERTMPDTTGWEYFEPLGHYRTNSLNDTTYLNFCYVNIGSGRLYLHTNPLVFSNYFMKKKHAFEYANEALSHLSTSPAIWDAYHQRNRFSMPDRPTAGSPLRFVFQNPPLKYSWYTFLVATLLFLLFRSKRQQNIIPILPKVENTSIAFAKSLGALYFQASSGRFLAIEQMKMFNNFNRRNYGIQRKVKDENLAEQIATKARVKIALVQEILNLELRIVYNPESRISEVIVLYKKLEEYYKLSRK